MKVYKKILAVVLTLAMVLPMATVSKTETKAEDTTVALANWTFAQGGMYSPNEAGNEGYIGSVTMNGTGEQITGWLKGNKAGEADPSVNQTQSATQLATGFAMDIENTGWDCLWSEMTGYPTDRINPLSVRAMMEDVSIEEGHTYTVSFSAYATENKFVYVSFDSMFDGVSVKPYEGDSLTGDNPLNTIGTVEKTYTYTFTNWVSAKSFTTTLMLGAFDAQYDLDGNDVSDIITKVENCWEGTVYVSDFTITDNGIHPDYVAPPVREETTTTTEVETTTLPSVENVDIAEGEKVESSDKWRSFSVCTREDGGAWEDALKGIRTDERPNGMVKGQDYATEGYIAKGATNSNFDFYVRSTGWDGEFSPFTNELIADNPWGMTATLTGIPVDNGRTYTISFEIKSTLTGSKMVTDGYGNIVKDEYGNNVTEPVTTKHALFKVYDPISIGEPRVEIISATGATTGGYITLDSTKDWQTITATIKIPDKASFPSNQMGVKFALGAFLYSYPDEIDMSGYVYVKNFQVIAGKKPYNVKLVDGDTILSEQAVMSGEMANYIYNTKEGYYLVGYKNSETGKLHDFNAAVTSDLILEAVWEPIKYQVVFKDGDTVISTQTVNHGTAATAPQLDKEGYTLSWDTTFDYVTEDLEVNAIWTFNKYKVVFKDGDLILKEQEVYYGYAAIAPEVAKSGYTLSWDKSFDAIKGDMIINAVWTQKNTETTNNVDNPGETTTVNQEKPTETTPINKPVETTATQKETSTNSIKVAKTKINKATKAKTSKKAKISLKKVKGASGYQVQISKKKNFKTVLIKKNVKKVSFSISSKKIKKLKKIYVRARAFVKKNGKTYYGDWSKAKKVKIK